MRLLIFGCLCFAVVFACVEGSFAQTAVEPVNITLALDKSTFTQGESIHLRVVIANNTRRPINTRSIPVSLYVTKRGITMTKCRFPDCFSAATYWAKKFKAGETRTLEVDLTNLYWNELIASGFDLRQPKNFYQKIAPGEYSLFMQFDLRTNPVTVTSNVLIIRVE